MNEEPEKELSGCYCIAVTQRPSALKVLTFWAGYVFVARSYSVHCKMFISILAYPLDAESTSSPSYDNQTHPQTLYDVPIECGEGQNSLSGKPVL